MRKYEVIIIWETGEREIVTKDTLKEAEEIVSGYKRAFGRQVWTCINHKYEDVLIKRRLYHE